MSMAYDPICGMSVSERTSPRVAKGGKDYFFCSEHCKESFVSQYGKEDILEYAPLKKVSVFNDKLFVITCVAIFFVFLSYLFAPLVMFRQVFFSYVQKIWWAVLLGLGLGGLIDYYVPREYISKVLSGKKASTIISAVVLGFLMSACSHGILALSIQLHKKGASGPAVVAFLLASPWANFTITVMLVSLFGLKGIYIIIAAVLIAVITGVVFMLLERHGLIETNRHTVSLPKQFSIHKDILRRMKSYSFSAARIWQDLKGVVAGAVSLARMVLWWLILGTLIASAAGAFIPVHIFHDFMGPTFLGLLVTLALATIIEVCSEGSSPLAFEIYRQTGALGNSFTFLMGGVVTDYTEIGLLWANVGKRTAIWLPLVTVPQVLLIGYLMNLFLR